jgi:Zn-dependent protease/predicted transcriptional regulator
MFGKSFRLFKVFGIPIQLDITFLIVLPLFTWMIGSGIKAGQELLGFRVDMRPLQEGALPYILGLIIVLGLFVSVLIHELGHALTARWYGVRTRSITLWLLGGVAQLESMPRQRGAEAIVAIVGPIVSFALAGVFFVLMLLWPTRLVAGEYVLRYLMSLNLALAIFNLLPALPLDGGRVLRSLLALGNDPLRATRMAATVSKLIAFAMGFFAIAAHAWWLLVIAFFIYMAVNAETQQSLIEHMLRGISVRDLMNRAVVSIPPSATVAELMSTMVRERHLGFPVVDDGQLLGMVDLSSVEGVDPQTPVQQIMRTNLRTIRPDEQALDAFTRMSQSGFARMIVVDESGRMIGIITKTDLMRAIQIRLAASGGADSGAIRAPDMDDDYAPARPIV